MKKTLALILAVIMVLTVIAGCAPTATDPDKEPNDPVSENTPQAGDITPVADGTICTVSPNSDVVLLNYSDISTFCPPNYTQAAEYVPGSLAYESLCDFDDNMNIRWVLATGVDISDDNLEYTFSLREGITFSDGTPWNAEALKANFDLMLDAEQAFLGVWLFEPVDHCEVVDEYTAKLVLKNTCASLLNILAAYGGFMSPALIEQGPEAWKNNVVGTGQYTLTEYRSGESMTFSLNRNYWGYDPEICGGTAIAWSLKGLLFFPHGSASACDIRSALFPSFAPPQFRKPCNEPKNPTRDIPTCGQYIYLSSPGKPSMDIPKVLVPQVDAVAVSHFLKTGSVLA